MAMSRIDWIKLIISVSIILNLIFIIYFNIIFKNDKIVKEKSHDQIRYLKIPLSQLNEYIKNESHKTNYSFKYNFSTNQSNFIGGYRDLPDTRHSSCAVKSYKLPYDTQEIVSVIIVYHNEARSTLIRTLSSIFKRTPLNYLKEIILIDDFNDDVGQGTELNFLPYIKLIRNGKRLGVIESRNYGAKISSGKYIVFLDSHCEVNVGWIEPLLARLTIYPGVAVSPILDSINFDTFQYIASSTNLKGGFDWNIIFQWIPMTEEERDTRKLLSDPFTSPNFSGGIFMVSREWFLKLHGFNPHLQIWGCESIEMAIKLWLCGGKIEIVPCSRIGHVFRNRHPFDFPHGSYSTYLKNAKIIADSWLDEYKYFFYSMKPEAKLLSSIGIQDSELIKKDLQCRPFKWFLKIVFPEMKIPNEEFLALGKIMCENKCLTVDKNDKNISITMRDCYKAEYITNWSLHTVTGQLTSELGACLNSVNNTVQLQYCTKGESQRWQRANGHLIHGPSHLCLEISSGIFVRVNKCRRGAPSQIFTFSIELQKL